MKNQKRIPLYTQISDYLMDQITQKIWQPNDKIPSENELSEQFQVSRITVKNAMQHLIDKGLIVRIQGKGTFVTSDRSEIPVLYQSTSQQSASKLVAWIMPRIFNGHTINLLNAVENEVAKTGYKLIFCKTHDSQEMESRLLHELIEMDVKGIIVFPVDGESYNEEILKLVMGNFPLVVIDRYLRGIETNCIVSDNIEGAYTAVSHLIELGHTKIGFVSTQLLGTSSVEDRLSGYEKAMAEHSIPFEFRYLLTNLDVEETNSIIHGEQASDSCKQLIREYLVNNPDISAILTANCAVGLNVLSVAAEMGIQIPEQLSLVFFDDDIPLYTMIRPTCIKQDEKFIGMEAAKLLFSLIENPKQQRKKIVVPTNLLVRNTTAKCPVPVSK